MSNTCRSRHWAAIPGTPYAPPHLELDRAFFLSAPTIFLISLTLAGSIFSAFASGCLAGSFSLETSSTLQVPRNPTRLRKISCYPTTNQKGLSSALSGRTEERSAAARRRALGCFAMDRLSTPAVGIGVVYPGVAPKSPRIPEREKSKSKAGPRTLEVLLHELLHLWSDHVPVSKDSGVLSLIHAE